jgi:hypothetical protein
MKTLTNLQADLVDGGTAPPIEPRSAVHLEPVKGLFVRAVLTPEALYFTRGARSICVPLAPLLTLTQIHVGADTHLEGNAPSHRGA